MLLNLENSNVKLVRLVDICKSEQKRQKAIKGLEVTFDMQDAFNFALNRFGNPTFVDEKGIMYWDVSNFDSET